MRFPNGTEGVTMDANTVIDSYDDLNNDLKIEAPTEYFVAMTYDGYSSMDQSQDVEINVETDHPIWVRFARRKTDTRSSTRGVAS